MSKEERKSMVSREEKLSIRQQCVLLLVFVLVIFFPFRFCKDNHFNLWSKFQGTLYEFIFLSLILASE